MKSAFSDFRIPVLNLAHVPDKMIDGMRSDLKVICKMLKAVREGKDVKVGDQIKHLEEFLEFAAALQVFSRDTLIEIEAAQSIDRLNPQEVGDNMEPYNGIPLALYYERSIIRRGKELNRKIGDYHRLVSMVDKYAQKHHMSAEEACAAHDEPYEEYLKAVAALEQAQKDDEMYAKYDAQIDAYKEARMQKMASDKAPAAASF